MMYKIRQSENGVGDDLLFYFWGCQPEHIFLDSASGWGKGFPALSFLFIGMALNSGNIGFTTVSPCKMKAFWWSVTVTAWGEHCDIFTHTNSGDNLTKRWPNGLPEYTWIFQLKVYTTKKASPASVVVALILWLPSGPCLI